MKATDERALFTLAGDVPRTVYRDPKTGILQIASSFGSDEYKQSYPAFVDAYRDFGLMERVRDRFHAMQASLYMPDRGTLRDILAYIATPVPPIRRVGRFLDVGCNTGSLLSKLPDPWERHGVEINVEAATAARSHRHLQIFQGSLEKYQPSVQFDFIRASHVVEHLEDYESFLRRLYELLAPGGYALLYTPNTESLSFRLFRNHWQPFYELTHVYLFGLSNLTAICQRLGFEVVESGTYYMGLWADSLLRALRVPPGPRFKAAFFVLMFALYPMGLLMSRLRLGSVLYLYLRRPEDSV